MNFESDVNLRLLTLLLGKCSPQRYIDLHHHCSDHHSDFRIIHLEKGGPIREDDFR